jgi:hypothetical protein
MLNKLFSKNGNGEKSQITISEILKGTTAGRMQSVGYMQVIPLISQIEDDRFVSPMEAEVSTRGYGSMVFKNPINKVLIIPLHAGYVVKQAAQDHAMSQVGVIGRQRKRVFNNSMCIQQTQGGYIPRGKHKMLILPFSLREAALKVRKKVSYNKLWDEISKFNIKMGARKGGHLEFFLDKFKNELDQFIAEFEPVPGQVGAIILIDGEVVGIERAPSVSYWLGIWPALIRECYGSLALEYQQSMGEQPELPKVRIPMSEDVTTLEDVLNSLNEASEKEFELAKNKIRDLLADPFKREFEERVDGLVVETLSHDQLYGQIIQEEGNVLYASLIVKHMWSKTAKWREAKPFQI